MPAVTHLAPEAWLAALHDPAASLRRCRCMITPVVGDWTTSPRIDAVYAVHYLWYLPRAELLADCAGREVRIPAGSLAWFPPAVPYEMRMRSRRRKEALPRLRFQLVRGDRVLSPFDDLQVVPAPAHLRELIERLHGEWAVERRFTEPATRLLLGEISLIALRAAEREGAGVLHPDQLAHLAAWFAERVHLRPAPADLAAVVGLSPIHFARLFSAAVGCSPRSWLVRERIRHAAERLRETDRPVAAVAAEFGYDNPFLFSRQFQRVMATSPSAWRRGRAQPG